MLQSVLTGSDDKQSLRLRRWAMATGLYVFFFLLLIVLTAQGLTRLGPGALAFLTTVLFGNVSFYVLIRSDRNLRYRDPSLTVAQMSYGSIWTFLIAYLTPELRPEVLMTYSILFFFGAFRLNTRTYLGVGGFAVLCYGLVYLVEFRWPPAAWDPLREGVRLGLFACVLGAIAFLGGQITALRRELLNQRKALTQANELIARQASHDELTEVYNRRYLMAELNREHARTERSGQPYSLALLDIDHFKAVNDHHGHLAGDAVLKQFATQLQHTLRGMDVLIRSEGKELLARYGGEEFVILLPETQGDAGMVCLERLRARVKELDFLSMAPPLQLTFSAGLAEAHPGEAPDAVLGRADAALYRAKDEGRDRCVLAD